MSKSFYVTTPIYYVNGRPHIGHAYTTIAADAFTRWRRAIGESAFFLTGTDEHGQKVWETANKRGMGALEHCDDMVNNAWKPVFAKLDLSYDRFFRTTDADHIAVVQAALRDLQGKTVFDPRTGAEEPMLYEAQYEGWYHVKDEIFVTEKDVEEGRYDRSELARITESNWWFRMGAFQERLLAHIEANPGFIQPEGRRNEVLGFLRKPLNDLCISRPKSRMPWGVEIPFAPDFVTYVWFDALLNYVTGTGWHPDPALRKPGWEALWPATVQLLGKDILTTHAVYWSTMLMALGLDLPETLFAHGWWTSRDGEKMSKSKGNVIDVELLVDVFGVDAVRYFLLREIAFGQDGGFSYEGFLVRYNADLANDLGNLAHRALSMTTQWLGGVVPAWSEAGRWRAEASAEAAAAVQGMAQGMSGWQPHLALEAAMRLARVGNLHIDQSAPWALNKAGDTPAVADSLRVALELCFVAATLLRPVMPAKMDALLAKLGRKPAQAEAWLREVLAGRPVALDALPVGSALQVGDPLFQRHREMPGAIAALFAPPAAEPVAEAVPRKPEVAYEDFAKLDLRAGRILAAEPHPKADKLLVLQVEVGDPRPRQIVAGIRSKYEPVDLIGRQVVVVCNLKPAKLRGVESQGMLLAAGAEAVVDLVSVSAEPGEVVR